MRGRAIILISAASLMLAGCNQKSSLYLEPGKKAPPPAKAKPLHPPPAAPAQPVQPTPPPKG